MEGTSVEENLWKPKFLGHLIAFIFTFLKWSFYSPKSVFQSWTPARVNESAILCRRPSRSTPIRRDPDRLAFWYCSVNVHSFSSGDSGKLSFICFAFFIRGVLYVCFAHRFSKVISLYVLILWFAGPVFNVDDRNMQW